RNRAEKRDGEENNNTPIRCKTSSKLPRWRNKNCKESTSILKTQNK
ncbi:Uncharacterized protein APZ42_000681, partial [Daphnia magna]